MPRSPLAALTSLLVQQANMLSAVHPLTPCNFQPPGRECPACRLLHRALVQH